MSWSLLLDPALLTVAAVLVVIFVGVVALDTRDHRRAEQQKPRGMVAMPHPGTPAPRLPHIQAADGFVIEDGKRTAFDSERIIAEETIPRFVEKELKELEARSERALRDGIEIDVDDIIEGETDD